MASGGAPVAAAQLQVEVGYSTLPCDPSVNGRIPVTCAEINTCACSNAPQISSELHNQHTCTANVANG